MDIDQTVEYMKEHALIINQNCFFLSGAVSPHADSAHMNVEMTLLVPQEVESQTNEGLTVVQGCQLVRFTNQGDPYMREFPLTAEEFIELGKLAFQFHPSAFEQTVCEEFERLRIANEHQWVDPGVDLWVENPEYQEEVPHPASQGKLQDRDNLDEVLHDLGDHPFGDG